MNGDASTSSIQRAMSSFDKELQIQKDIAAKEKQKLALLQVKKESYINYLKNKGNTPWIPGGQGAKHESSLHKSVNKSAAEQRMLQRAWCRSPWPGQLPKNVNTEAETEPFKFNDSYDVRDEDNDFQLQSPVGKLYDRISSPQRSPVPIAPRYCTSPQRLPARAHVGQQQQLQAPPLPAATPANMRSPSGGDSYSVSSTQNSRASTANARKNRSSSAGTGTVGKGSSSDGNSKYVALTVRLIQAAQSHRSAYGVFIVPRNCTRLEMIANLERQFNVHNQVSDISITYRTGYSHGVTIKSLSMGTIADVPQLDDYSSITVFLGGSTIFDSAGNIITHSEKGDVTAPYVSHTDLPSSLSPSPAVVVGAGVGNGKSVSPMMTVLTKGGIHGRSSGNIYDHSNHYTLQRSPSQGFLNPASTSASTIATTSAAAMTRGLSTGDNLLYFDDNTSVNSDDASSTYSRASKVSRLSQLVPPAPSTGNILPYGATATTTSAATFTAAARNASQGKSGNGINRPVPVPMYENLHPEQPMHGFSYISPAQPLLADSLAAAVLTSVNDPHSAEFNDAATALTATSGGTGAGHTGGGGVTGKSVAAAAGTNSSVAGASSRGLSRGYSTRSLLAQQQQQQLQSQRVRNYFYHI